MKLHNENCIQDIPGAHLHKWLWVHKLQIYEKLFPFPCENTWLSSLNIFFFIYTHMYIYIFTFALLQTGIEEFRKLVGNLNKTKQKNPKNKCCFLALVNDQIQLNKYFTCG